MALIEINLQLALRRSAFDAKLRKAVADGMEDALDDPIKLAAVDGSPRRRGTNRRSINFDVDRARLTGRLFTQSGYGGYLEVGTSKMAARPYMVPAVEKNKGAFAKAIKRHIL